MRTEVDRSGGLWLSMLLALIGLGGVLGMPAALAQEPELRGVPHLIGIGAVGFPSIKSQAGTATYRSGTGILEITTPPGSLTLTLPGAAPVSILEPTLVIRITLNDQGQVTGGDPNGPDLLIRGKIAASPSIPGSPYPADAAAPPIDLLTGEIVVDPKVMGFGFRFGFRGLRLDPDDRFPEIRYSDYTDRFDFRFTPAGGALLAGPMGPFFTGQDIGAVLALEVAVDPTSRPSFKADFSGTATVAVGPVPTFCIDLRTQVECPLDIDYCKAFPFVDADHRDDPDRYTQIAAGSLIDYRLLIRNCGRIDLKDITLEHLDPDPSFNVVNFILKNDALAPGDEITVDENTENRQSNALTIKNVHCFLSEDDPQNIGVIGYVTYDFKVTAETRSDIILRRITDSDVAVGECNLTRVSLGLEKQINTEGMGFVTADRIDDPNIPTVPFPANAEHRLSISNQEPPEGSALGIEQEFLVNDPILGINNFEILQAARVSEVVLAVGDRVEIDGNRISIPGNPLTGAPPREITPGIAQLGSSQRCRNAGIFTNVSRIEALLTEQVGGGPLTNNSHQALLACAGNPQIELKKEFIVNGQPVTGPVLEEGQNIGYRLTVTNTGTLNLAGVALIDQDPILGTLVLPRSDLSSPLSGGVVSTLLEGVLNDPCGNPAALTALQNIQATGFLSSINPDNPEQVRDRGNQVTLTCAGDSGMTFIKEISVDGGRTFMHADESGSAPVVRFPGDGIQYRLTVRNTGMVELQVRVVDPDPALNINEGPFPLAPDASQTFTRTVNQRCPEGQEFVPNTAMATGTSASQTLRREDSAVLRCVSSDIVIDKQVSRDGGNSFINPLPGDPDPTVQFGQSLIYRFIVTNTGGEDLRDVVISDSLLEVTTPPLDNLSSEPGFNSFSVTLAPVPVDELCNEAAPRISNTATVNGVGVLSGQPVTPHHDSLTLRCVRPDDGGADDPQIDIEKLVSVGGKPFEDADQEGANAPAAEVGDAVRYRLIVSNPSAKVTLRNVTVEDAQLGLSLALGSLAPGGSIAREHSSSCETSNTASARGESDDGRSTTDSDQAVVNCVESQLQVRKQISVDGGRTFFDADRRDDPGGVPAIQPDGGALYRLLISNNGTTDLRNLLVNDPVLGIQDFAAGDLAIGTERTLTPAELPALQVSQEGGAQRCATANSITNEATVSGQAVQTGKQVSATDRAVLLCMVPIPTLDGMALILTAILLTGIALVTLRLSR